MAFDYSKLNFFKRLNARSRVLVLIGIVIGIIVLIYFGTGYFYGGGETGGAARVAAAPPGLQTVPGGEITPEYQRALQLAQEQAARQAQITGTSAVPTVINVQGAAAPQTGGCVICAEESANVKDDLDSWVSQGKISPDVANELKQLADQNAAVEEYAARLAELVKQGKLTAEQARRLLEKYKKQHANHLLNQSAQMMDGLIKSGQLPVDAANELLNAQKEGVNPGQYASDLDRLTKEGKITPATAQQLLAQYTKQRAAQIINQSIVILQQMAKRGELTPDVLNVLVDLEKRMVPADLFATNLQKLLSEGKITPAVSKKILDEYLKQKSEIGPSGSLNDLINQAEAAAYQELSDLLKANKITREAAQQLASMIQQNVPLVDFENFVNQLVQEQKLTPEIGKLKIDDYRKIKGLRELAQTLSTLQGNNAMPAAYANALKEGVQNGLLSPDQAAQLMKEYEAARATQQSLTPTQPTGNEAFDRLQQQVGQAPVSAAPSTEFAAAETAAVQETEEQRQARIKALMGAMSSQAQQLVAAWQPPTMEHKAGTPPPPPPPLSTEGKTNASNIQASWPSNLTDDQGRPFIKAGTILFAVLDTAINSDYPDSPVLATIVAGQFKGAKLLGKLMTTKGVSGQQDRVSLNFTLMDMKEWIHSIPVTAFAIDPDTARTVMASNVNYHYLQRFGAIMATSFLEGYGNALLSSGATSTTGIFGTSSTNPQLSPGQKIAVALGQIGKTLGAVTKNYVNIPPTVKVDSGVGLGILFMAEVAAANDAANASTTTTTTTTSASSKTNGNL